MTSSKLRFKIGKMKSINKATLFQLSKDLKALSKTGGTQFDRELILTKLKIAQVVNDDNTIDLFEILVVDCEVLHSKLHQLLCKSDDEDIVKLVRELMYVSSYVNIKEFKKLVALLAHKYGKEFYENALNHPDNPEIVHKCNGKNVDSLVEMYLQEICDCYQISLKNEAKDISAPKNESTDSTTKNETDLDDLRRRFNALRK
ncbi:hypothetical protein KL930_004556 [Ogataea haglerorum]|uniref:Uncharacterized protein n=1 Tax=Ogataea haglerorum TaxID=1937702 RepID=A0AAN6D2B5_9ASCO|nr:uncharacterized protein KL911_005361 [Ogataea haglerorum]KAG7691672.1 hypothetical protein KL951_005301 [Ogataea haglerorum]KAG7692460.1 hypothetical protein KL915_004507 [Ogataea haglerorum]KAG7702157.1 hypothetical protein KL950_005355 [Ogataea haglerorum]KAG7704028.1 hypothetical protein KL914_004519 [Ogataea haglerorum]KAG7715648.1 hypothetical protein KL913_003983 [Ogataea haglerorum]